MVFVIELFLELIEAAVNGMMVMAVRWFSGFGSRARFTGMAGRAMWADNNWTRMANGRTIGATETPGIDFIVGSEPFFRCCC